jgi:L-lactate dehydrogenase complex protein LldG
MPDERTRVLGRVRAALAPLRSQQPAPDYPDDVALSTPPGSPDDSVSTFVRAVGAAGGRAFTTVTDLAKWLTERGVHYGYCDPALVAEVGPAFQAPFVLETRLAVDRIDAYEFGITRSAGAIAETGTIVLNDACTSRRLAALAPWFHIAVVRPTEIHWSVADAIRSLGSDPYVVWCTGPSKTADVEGILIQGVHGPGEQIALIVAA